MHIFLLWHFIYFKVGDFCSGALPAVHIMLVQTLLWLEHLAVANIALH
jgi:hypothetical protein